MSRVLSRPKPVEPADGFARMKKLAHAAFGREVLRKVSDVILPLNDVGDGPALYCVHPITGAATNFSAMAQMLGPTQRFFGIQTPTKKRTAEFAGSIEAISAFYVDHLIRFQPFGDFVLGGHSVGALIALEMAQQLRSLGRTVSLLVVFDGELLNTGTEIGRRHPAYWLKQAANFPAWVRDFLMVEFTFRKFCQTVLSKITMAGRMALAKLRGEANLAGHAVGGFVDLKQFTPDHAAYMKALFEVQYNYQPKRYEGNVLVCVAKTQALFYYRQIERAWRAISPQAEFVRFDGTHTSIMQSSKGLAVAKHLGRRLKALDQQQSSARSADSPETLSRPIDETFHARKTFG
jgi:thioesterase domain-containing protein